MNGSNLWSWHSAQPMRRAEPGDRHRPHAVGGVLGQVLLRLGAALAGHHVQAVEAGGDELLGRRVGQQVAGELLDRELVERLVAVERVDDVVAVREDALVLVAVVADRVGEPHQVEPGHGHPLAVMGRGEQPVDLPLVGVGSVSSPKAWTSSGVGGRPVRSRLEPAEQRPPVGLGRRARALAIRGRSRMNASIGLRTHARLLDRGNGRAHRRRRRPSAPDTRPPRLIHRLSSSFCAAVSVLCDFRRRHELVGIVAEDALDQLALVGLARDDRLSLASAESRTSSRRSALRWFLSGPWQAKQFSDRIGRMSRLNSTLPRRPASAAVRSGAESSPIAARPVQTALASPHRIGFLFAVILVTAEKLLAPRPPRVARPKASAL